MVAAEKRQAAQPPGERPTTTLAWGRAYLRSPFRQAGLADARVARRASSTRCARNRGTKVNVIGPRGSAKSTIATLCHVLRAAVEGWEPYIWIVSDTKEQAQIHLDNIKAELIGQSRCSRNHYPQRRGHGPALAGRPRSNSRNGVAIESYGTGQSIRGRRRRRDRPTLIVCDDLQNDSHISSAAQRDASRQWFHGTLLNAGTKDTNIVNLATALHREALALELHRTAGWTSRSFPAIESWPTNIELWNEWESIYCDADNPNAKHAAREFYEQHHDADGRRRRRALAGRRGPVHADADARGDRPHGIRARKAGFAGEPRVLRVAGRRTSPITSGSTAGRRS